MLKRWLAIGLAAAVLAGTSFIASGCTDIDQPKPNVTQPAPLSSRQVGTVWYGGVTIGTRIDGMPKESYGYIDTDYMFIRPQPDSSGRNRWFMRKTAFLAPVANSFQTVLVTFDAGGYAIDAAAACKRLAEQGVNLKQRWKAFKLTETDPTLVEITARNDNCSPDMPQ